MAATEGASTLPGGFSPGTDITHGNSDTLPGLHHRHHDTGNSWGRRLVAGGPSVILVRHTGKARFCVPARPPSSDVGLSTCCQRADGTPLGAGLATGFCK